MSLVGVGDGFVVDLSTTVYHAVKTDRWEIDSFSINSLVYSTLL